MIFFLCSLAKIQLLFGNPLSQLKKLRIKVFLDVRPLNLDFRCHTDGGGRKKEILNRVGYGFAVFWSWCCDHTWTSSQRMQHQLQMHCVPADTWEKAKLLTSSLYPCHEMALLKISGFGIEKWWRRVTQRYFLLSLHHVCPQEKESFWLHNCSCGEQAWR